MELLSPIIGVLDQALQALYGLTGSAVATIVLLTGAIRAILHPLTRKQLHSMKLMQTLAPQVEVLRRKHKDNPRQLNEEVMRLYRSHNANPLGGCLPLLLQFPILIALYNVIGSAKIFAGETLFGVPLNEKPSPAVIQQHPLLALLPILNGLVSYLQQHVSVTDPQQARMFIFMPFFLAWISLSFPIALSIYWIASTALYVVEYLVVVGPPKRIGVAPPKEQRRSGRAHPKSEQDAQ